MYLGILIYYTAYGRRKEAYVFGNTIKAVYDKIDDIEKKIIKSGHKKVGHIIRIAPLMTTAIDFYDESDIIYN